MLFFLSRVQRLALLGGRCHDLVHADRFGLQRRFPLRNLLTVTFHWRFHAQLDAARTTRNAGRINGRFDRLACRGRVALV